METVTAFCFVAALETDLVCNKIIFGYLWQHSPPKFPY